MPLTERITNVDELKSWKDQIPLRYEYTAGVAGEKFLRGLQGGKILASRCGKCGRSYLPPKMYCVEDFSEIKDFPQIRGKGRLVALAESHVDFAGRKTKRGTTFVFVSFDGVEGGLIHRGIGAGLVVGSKVIPRFRPVGKRKGMMLDIEGFVKA